MFRALRFVLLATAFVFSAFAQQFNPALFGEMRWRMIGPFRGGRTVAISGVPQYPNLFYMAAVNGGVWKSTDYGRTWQPIFDREPSGSVGALAVAPSDPKVIYVGSGEGLRRPDLSIGDGIYKSTDGGQSWQHLGLRDGQQISAIIVDPRDPNRVFVAVLGHPYGPNPERGVFRSTDGGQNWTKVLYKDENVGAVDLAFDPANPNTVYAALWASRRPPWSVSNPFNANGSGLYKSTDGGDHWQQLTGGLPTDAQGLGRIGIAIAPNDPRRMYALVDAGGLTGLYRSDDAGDSWTRVNSEERISGRGSDFAGVRVAPNNKDTVYVANTSTYRSTDGGQNFTAIKGAPGGDDYHTIWINPKNPDIIFLGSDQGATLSVNGEATWSSWYNQPTSQFYHVITDNQFPYWVYGGQQESGSIGTTSRSDYGEITFRDWITVGTEEYGYVAPDPLDPNIIYGGKATRYNRVTHQTQDVSPVVLRTGKYNFNRTAPLLFSPVDPHTLYLGSNVLFKTSDGGNNWQIISPDLARPDPGIPPNLGEFAAHDPSHNKHRGVIYSIGPSPKDVNLIWVGTDDGLIHVTADGGKTWKNVTPPELTPWSKVAQLDASHFDTQFAYAAVNRFRLDDLHPYIYRTHDGGKTWQKITNGLPDNEPANTVREDRERKGLLFAGTERSIYVSFNDGEQWQSLQLNLPPSSMRDLVVHGDDVVVGTHGRSFWILDDITPLRQLTPQTAQQDAILFRPQLTYRMRRSTNTDTPLPPETPAGENPPNGAILDYYLKANPGSPVMLEIFDSSGRLVRRFSSADQPEPIREKEMNVPVYWAKPPRVLSAEPGMHRWIWDLHYPTPEFPDRDYPISAIPHDTPLDPRGPRALPGTYTVKLTAGGRNFVQQLVLKMDPRVKTSPQGLAQQFKLEMKIANSVNADYQALQQVRAAREQLKKMHGSEQAAGTITVLDQKLATLEGTSGGYSATYFTTPEGVSLARLNAGFQKLYTDIDGADMPPTTEQTTAFNELQRALDADIAKWNDIKAHDLPAIER
ncbi:MAG TPA: glycoside hydrolase [Terriglobales bacterium]|nr:glycoside hydrolase [Terriglobales bacterium]